MSGAAAGFISGAAVCPLDVAKTRLQAQGAYYRLPHTPKYKGLFHTIHVIFTEEGLRGLYRGLVPITLGYLPTWMIYFSVYEKAKVHFANRHPEHPASAVEVYIPALLVAASALLISTNPIWVVKTRMMLLGVNSNTPVYKGTWDCFKQMYTHEGIRLFYAGMVPLLFGLLHVAVHFPVYETLKLWLGVDSDGLHRLGKLIAASSLSKMCASSITYPHEVVRTRMQLYKDGPRRGMMATIAAVFRKEHLRGFYSGFAVNLMRTVPASAVTLVSFEYIKQGLGG